jgi:TetR/AcrR family transcriptional regulator, cholesterol catabolism regulator
MSTKERIKEQATEMFLRSGIKAITMDDISREIGMSKRTIYENFKDKDELLRECLTFIDKKYEREHELITLESEHTISEVFSMMKLGIYAIKTISPLFFSDLKKYHYRIYKEVLQVNEVKQINKTHTLLKKGINQGVFRSNIDLEIVSILLNEQLTLISDDNVFPERKFSRVVVFENVLINFFRGIATKKGIDLIEQYYQEESNFFITS